MRDGSRAAEVYLGASFFPESKSSTGFKFSSVRGNEAPSCRCSCSPAAFPPRLGRGMDWAITHDKEVLPCWSSRNRVDLLGHVFATRTGLCGVRGAKLHSNRGRLTM